MATAEADVENNPATTENETKASLSVNVDADDDSTMKKTEEEEEGENNNEEGNSQVIQATKSSDEKKKKNDSKPCSYYVIRKSQMLKGSAIFSKWNDAKFYIANNDENDNDEVEAANLLPDDNREGGQEISTESLEYKTIGQLHDAFIYLQLSQNNGDEQEQEEEQPPSKKFKTDQDSTAAEGSPAAATGGGTTESVQEEQPQQEDLSKEGSYYSIRKSPMLEGPAILFNWEDTKFYLEDEDKSTSIANAVLSPLVDFQQCSTLEDAITYQSDAGAATKGTAPSSPQTKRKRKRSSTGKTKSEAPTSTTKQKKKEKQDKTWAKMFIESFDEYYDKIQQFKAEYGDLDVPTRRANYIVIMECTSTTDNNNDANEKKENMEGTATDGAPADAATSNAEATIHATATDAPTATIAETAAEATSNRVAPTPNAEVATAAAIAKDDVTTSVVAITPQQDQQPGRRGIAIDQDKYNCQLGHWSAFARKQVEEHEASSDSCLLSDEQIQKLKEIGFSVNMEPAKRGINRSSTELQPAWNQDRYEELQEFQRKKGHCAVPAFPKSPLREWIDRVILAYSDFHTGVVATITNDQIAQLTELGMDWTQKRFYTFEENADRWHEYKITHNGNDPPSQTRLGRWVRHTRKKYSKLVSGEKYYCTLKQSQIDYLTAKGFEWESKYKKVNSPAKLKSFDDRIKELLEYKDKHGNCLVPQKLSGLGQWVHSQRKDFRNWKLVGKESAMTEERYNKLVEIGFVFYVNNNFQSTSTNRHINQAIFNNANVLQEVVDNKTHPKAVKSENGGDVIETHHQDNIKTTVCAPAETYPVTEGETVPPEASAGEANTQGGAGAYG